MTIDVAILIAMFTAAIAFAGWLSSTKKDAGKREAQSAAMMTQLNAIAEDTKDIKAENRSLRTEIMEVRQVAIHAQERAEAAHKRLDRSGIDAHD